MLNVALHQQSRILKLSAGPRDLGLPTQIGHCVFRLKISETLIFSPLGRSHDSEIQKRSRVQPDRTPTPSTENRASPHCARPEQGQIFGDIGKSLPNWTERATETLRASSFGGDLQKRGDRFKPLGHFKSPRYGQHFRYPRKEATKGLCAHSNATAISSDYRLVKIELCMIAMMNMEVGLAQRCATTRAQRMLENGKAANEVWRRRGPVHSVVELPRFALIHQIGDAAIQEVAVQTYRFCCELDLRQPGQKVGNYSVLL
jgi:hypothetical protein